VSGDLLPPTLLTPHHILDEFTCGIPELDIWLRDQASRNQKQDTSQTYVVCRGAHVIGFYALAANAIARLSAPKSIARNTPDPIPVILLGRLGVHESEQGSGLGRALLRDALLRSMRTAETIGVRAVMVAAISESAAAFYRKYEFMPSPVDPMLLFLPMRHIRQQFGDAFPEPSRGQTE
jgi:GNAT superfamily N-acetyltransferase